MKKGYIVGRIDVVDLDRYHAYLRLAAAAVKANGGVVLSGGRRAQELEGKSRGHNVIVEFQTFEAACAYFNSPEYELARRAREGAAIVEMIALEGV
ncbi:DUF1330 domain-containing protein [Bradyrhizobium sp. 14AA]